MKVLIVGPVQSDKYFGGVATFTESLADGFKINGFEEVEILTDYTIKPTTHYGCAISAIFKEPKRRNPLILRRLAHQINIREVDLIITSLEYGLSLLFIKKNSAVKIHYLHAFPARTMAGFFKTIGLNKAMKLISRKADFMISNSSLTSVVNKEIYGIKSDNIISIGLGYEFIDAVNTLVLGNSTFKKNKKRGQILYAGRMASEKNIYSIIESVEALYKEKDIDFNMIMIGEGEDYPELAQKYNQSTFPIEFIGAKNQDTIVKYYLESEVFISMNPHEPFGITYLEALFTNCKIVCPLTGGHMDFSNLFHEHFFLTNPYDCTSIKESLKDALQSDIPSYNKNIERFNYANVANDIINYVFDK
ncbi:glycosyltransferase family 4 protein [Fulvivirga sediminis]|uniref:Glycosyltransferase family 4 protein n=1 Tax=Fulvivirga sediminis TaxID=2803949 RepID=A0A937F676_9BACT|nr:glycosyltransferase family 4 protein [Fulvivirga sediminis]MBL3654838.1 glycosyltransferase family 4 protein [Fulvivirga sediminis]